MSRTNHRNYYRLLHVQPDAPLEVIKASYRVLMRSLKHHPDLGGDQWDAALINEAYEVLSVPEKRKTYDRERRSLGNGLTQIARSPSRATRNRANLALVSSIHLASPGLPSNGLPERGTVIEVVRDDRAVAARRQHGFFGHEGSRFGEGRKNTARVEPADTLGAEEAFPVHVSGAEL